MKIPLSFMSFVQQSTDQSNHVVVVNQVGVNVNSTKLMLFCSCSEAHLTAKAHKILI